MKRLCFLAVAAAMIALSEAVVCPTVSPGGKKLVAHETDCTKYYECTSTGSKEMDCTSIGTVKWCFDRTKEACVVPHENCCKPAPGGEGSCTDTSKCKMYFSDDVVEVCVKKPGTLPKFF